MSTRRIVFAALTLALFACEQQPTSVAVDVEPAFGKEQFEHPHAYGPERGRGHDKAAPAADWVTICHFPGHVSRTPIGNFGRDFVTFIWITSPTGQPDCESKDGMAIVVSARACEIGHKAVAIPGPDGIPLDCKSGDRQARD